MRGFTPAALSLLAPLLILAAPGAGHAAPPPPGVAPGGPGAAGTWTPAGKHGFGTATGSTSKVWYTLEHSQLTEVYYPDLGTPSLRDLQFIVTDGRTFADLESRATTSTEYQPGSPYLAGGPGYLPGDPVRLPGAGPPVDLERLADLVSERLAERAGHHLGGAGEMPSVAEAVELRERAPELYDLWLRLAAERAATGNYVRRAPYELPERLAHSGRARALSALVLMLVFCGYLAWLGGAGPYIAGLLAVADLTAMLSLFFGLRPGRTGRP
jgi:Glucodextranase, domain N